MRRLQYGYDYLWGNSTDDNYSDFDSNLQKAEDVSVDAVVTSLYYNAIVFAVLMTSYEGLRRLLPAVYSSKKRMQFVRPDHLDEDDPTNAADPRSQFLDEPGNGGADPRLPPEHDDGFFDNSESLRSLPDNLLFDWIAPVFGVPWHKVRKMVGLDGYFFLRYIRMNVRITAVSTFWFFLILVPVYYTGSNPDNAAKGWYHLSATNIPASGWRMWMPVLFSYLFTSFIIFVMKQEYKHFLELRQDFLARGNAHVHPQHHYSLLVENIPYEMRSEHALFDYFEKLFPGKVHSTSIVMKLPDLEKASNRCLRTCRRLEKSLAYWHAEGARPTHVVGRGRLSLLGVEMEPFDIPNCTADPDDALMVEDEISTERTPKGTLVDSISYYTQELAAHSKALFLLQQRKTRVAEFGRTSVTQATWLDGVVHGVEKLTGEILQESMMDNSLACPSHDWELANGANDPHGVPQAERMTSKYGSFSAATLEAYSKNEEKGSPLLSEADQLVSSAQFGCWVPVA
jgi:hypothetical protein